MPKGRATVERDPIAQDFMGVSELAELLVVSRQRADQLCRTKGFPDPVATLRMGSFWRTSDVIGWWTARVEGRAVVSASS